MTGFGLEEPSMGAKWVELLKEISPRVARASVLFNAEIATFARMFLPSMEAAARTAGLTLTVTAVRNGAEIEQAIAAAGREPDGGLIALPDSFLIRQRDMIVAATARRKVPAVYALRLFPAGGGLIAYGIDRVDLFRLAATYVDRILKGDRPADLPVQMPTKFELVINLKTARALGLDVPATLLVRSDEVIECTRRPRGFSLRRQSRHDAPARRSQLGHLFLIRDLDQLTNAVTYAGLGCSASCAISNTRSPKRNGIEHGDTSLSLPESHLAVRTV
jgi:ABC transporter substrate binding protein